MNGEERERESSEVKCEQATVVGVDVGASVGRLVVEVVVLRPRDQRRAAELEVGE